MSGQTSYGQNDGSAFIDGFNSVGVVHNDAQGYLSTSKIVAEDISANAITSDKLANDISYNGLFKVNNIDNVSVDSQVANKKYVDDQITEIRGGVPQVTVDTLKELSEKLVDASGTEIFARLANPTFTGTVSGITKSMVGLGNVDNTSDASKPVSTAQQTALDLKAPLVSPTFTGTVTISDNITVSDFSTGVLHSDASGNLSSSLIVAADITNSAIVSDKISSNAVSSDKLAVDISYNGILKVVDCSGGSVNQVANKGYVDSKIIDSYSTISKILVSTTPPSNPDVGAIYIAPTGSNIYSEGIIIAENIPFPWLRVCALNSSGVKIWHSLTTYDDARPL